MMAPMWASATETRVWVRVQLHQRARADPTGRDVSGSVWSLRSGGLALGQAVTY
jgi:hypothetical protein